MSTYTNYSKLEVDGTISSSVQGELIGTFTTMPTASALNEGKTIYYTGATSGNYVQNTFYTCVNNSGTYSWTSASPKQVSVDSALSETSTNPVQNKVIATALKGYATKDDIATVYKPKGSIASASLPQSARIGDVYNLTDASSYGPAGTNVVYTEEGWDALSGIVDISGKQDKISSGTGISISGNTVSLATSGVTAGTKGGTTAVPVIAVDAYGRVTSIGSETIYPPTTVGTSGQIWVSDGNGTGTWQSKDTTPTSGSTNAITSGAVYSELAKKQPNLTFDSTPTQNSSNPVTSGGVYNALAGKQPTLVFDSAPKSGSSNPVTSGGIYTAIDAKQSKLTFDSTPTEGSSNPVTSGGIFNAIKGKQDKLTFDSTPTSGSGNPVTSGGIYTAIANKMDKVTSVGSSSKPVYINSSGVPTACSYSIGTAASYGVATSVTSESSDLVTSGAVYTAINSIVPGYTLRISFNIPSDWNTVTMGHAGSTERVYGFYGSGALSIIDSSPYSTILTTPSNTDINVFATRNCETSHSFSDQKYFSNSYSYLNIFPQPDSNYINFNMFENGMINVQSNYPGTIILSCDVTCWSSMKSNSTYFYIKNSKTIEMKVSSNGDGTCTVSSNTSASDYPRIYYATSNTGNFRIAIKVTNARLA